MFFSFQHRYLVTALAACLALGTARAQESQESLMKWLFGPSIAVAPERKPDVAIPKPNLIDQSVGTMNSKSRGCIECHENALAHVTSMARRS